MGCARLARVPAGLSRLRKLRDLRFDEEPEAEDAPLNRAQLALKAQMQAILEARDGKPPRLG